MLQAVLVKHFLQHVLSSNFPLKDFSLCNKIFFTGIEHLAGMRTSSKDTFGTKGTGMEMMKARKKSSGTRVEHMPAEQNS